jgi:DNA-binding transcriptional ArsR family regulator
VKLLYHPDVTDTHLSTVLDALSDPIRLLIISELHNVGESACGDINVPVVKSTASHHIRTLRESGIANVRVQGTQRLVSLRTDDLNLRFPGLLASILGAFETSEEKRKLLHPES